MQAKQNPVKPCKLSDDTISGFLPFIQPDSPVSLEQDCRLFPRSPVSAKNSTSSVSTYPIAADELTYSERINRCLNPEPSGHSPNKWKIEVDDIFSHYCYERVFGLLTPNLATCFDTLASVEFNQDTHRTLHSRVIHKLRRISMVHPRTEFSKRPGFLPADLGRKAGFLTLVLTYVLLQKTPTKLQSVIIPLHCPLFEVLYRATLLFLKFTADEAVTTELNRLTASGTPTETWLIFYAGLAFTFADMLQGIQKPLKAVPVIARSILVEATPSLMISVGRANWE